MKLAGIFLVLSTLAVAAAAQTVSPELVGSAVYTMPQSAIDAEFDGKAVMALTVDTTGHVKEARLFAGPSWPCGKDVGKAFSELKSTLVDAMKKLEFKPAQLSGKPVEDTIGLTITLKNPKLWKSDISTDVSVKPRLVKGGVVNGKAISLPAPAYPIGAHSSGARGTVEVELTIDENGRVIRAGATSGAPALQGAARDAACRAKFSPTTLSGQPVKVMGVVVYNFMP